MSLINSTAIPSGASAYELEQSLRFDGSSGYLSKSFASAGNRRTWTMSFWLKRSKLTTQTHLFTASNADGSVDFSCYLGANDRLYLADGIQGGGMLQTTQVFRDTSAWLHIVVALDSTQGTVNNRLKLYINGTQVTSFAANNLANGVTQNKEMGWNVATTEHRIARRSASSSSYLGGYLGEVNFIDGTAKAPADFGETGTYGEWKPIEYSGSYGTNGFYLPFKQDYTVEGFSTVTYTGNSVDNNYIGGTGFKPDFTWIKDRNNAGTHALFDSVRGATKLLASNSTAIEDTAASYLKTFETDGFTLGTDSGVNYAARTYVAWNWDMGGSNATNTAGTIQSTVRANPTYGQSIVSWTGTGATGTVGTGLTSDAEVVIVKGRTTTDNWGYADTIQGGGTVRGGYLNATARIDDTDWSSRLDPSSSTSNAIGVYNWDDGNKASTPMIAYCFHSVTGYSKFGTYDGDGTYDGSNAVNVGFTPAWVMIKCTNDSESWWIFDSTRSPLGTPFLGGKRLAANSSNAELSGGSTGSDLITFTSTGFKMTGQGGGTNGGSGQKYIYMAFADTREYAYWLDQSGNNNDWTSNNLTESDVMVDSPTNNFATLNTLDNGSDTLSEGNLKLLNNSSDDHDICKATFGVTSGKWYWEFLHTVSNSVYYPVGITTDNESPENELGGTANGWAYLSDARKRHSGSVANYGATFTAGDIIGVALDMETGDIEFYKNNSSQGVAYTGLTGTILPALGGFSGTQGGVVNFGQDSSFAGTVTPQGNQDGNSIGDFYYTPPTGFLALCTSNLPDVAVVPSENFNPVIYTGDGNTTNAITGVGFQPDFTWIKHRTATYNHALFDAVRGATKEMASNTTSAEATETTSLKSFNADGFTLGDKGGVNNSTGSANNFISWNWKANGSGSSNTNGSINSTVSANVDAGFSIVSYTGTGANATVGHGLSSAPELVIYKNRNDAGSTGSTNGNWIVQSTAIGVDDYLELNDTAAEAADSGYFRSTRPSSTLLTLGAYNSNNGSSDNMIAYAFHSVNGYSKVGSYTGNGNADGPFVYTGFRPAFILIKNTSAAGTYWHIADSKRLGRNVIGQYLFANTNEVESNYTEEVLLDITSNGFKLRGLYGHINGNGNTITYLAFAETPFKYSNAR